jgi:hypothetical protein
MNAARQWVAVWKLASAIVTISGAWSQAAPLVIWNPSFETPAYSDGSYAALQNLTSQGGYGWLIGDSAGIYNPPAADYTGAGGAGNPAGADGSQVGWIAGFGDYQLVQRLAGADGVPDNSDDPKFEPFTIYTLKVAVGQRAAGNVFGTTNGGYDIQLRAGQDGADPIVAQETDAVALTPGTLIERTIVWDSALADAAVLGQPIVIRLRKTIVGAATDTDFDNVRLDATFVPPSADFNGDGMVNGADLTTWENGFGASGATPMQGDAGRDLKVDGADFLLWQRQLGSPSVNAAPEPAAGALAWLSLGGSRLAVRRRRLAPYQRTFASR